MNHLYGNGGRLLHFHHFMYICSERVSHPPRTVTLWHHSVYQLKINISQHRDPLVPKTLPKTSKWPLHPYLLGIVLGAPSSFLSPWHLAAQTHHPLLCRYVTPARWTNVLQWSYKWDGLPIGHVRCHMSHVKCHFSFTFFFLFYKVGELVGEGLCYQWGLHRLFLKQIRCPNAVL